MIFNKYINLCLGLYESKTEKLMRIAKDHARKNYKSKIEGGQVVITVDRYGREVMYDKIKNVDDYLHTTFKNMGNKLVGAYVGWDRMRFVENYFN